MSAAPQAPCTYCGDTKWPQRECANCEKLICDALSCGVYWHNDLYCNQCEGDFGGQMEELDVRCLVAADFIDRALSVYAEGMS